MDTLFDSRPNKKNGGRSALYFLLLGVCFGRQSTGLIEITNKNERCSPDLLGKHNGRNNLVHKRLGGMVAGTAVGIG